MKTVFAIIALLAASLVASAVERPKTVIHAIHLKWKEGTTADQKQKVYAAIDQLAKDYPAIKRVWLRQIKMQTPEGFTDMIVMEFASEDALAKYSNSPAQKKFYEVYMPLREESRTNDVTN